MDVGMQGFLVTCNKNESQAVKEMYNLLNEYADKLYGPEQYLGVKNKHLDDNAEKCEDDDEEDDEEDEEEDIEKALEKEVSALKERLPAERRFQQLDTGAKNCLFIKTTLSTPCELIHTILEDVYETQIQKSRFALRVLPVQTICRANITDISNSAQDLFEPFFRTAYGTMLTYGISFKARMTCKVSRDEVINSLCHIIAEMNPLNKVNYSNPDLIVLVELLRGLCCLSVVKDFNKFRKYNLQETARAQQAANGKGPPADSNSTALSDSTSKSAAETTTKNAVDTASINTEDTGCIDSTNTVSTGATDTASKSAADIASKDTATTTSASAVDTASKGAVDTASKGAADTASASATYTSMNMVDSKCAADTASTDAADTASYV